MLCRSNRAVVATALVAGLVFAGCGDDADSSGPRAGVTSTSGQATTAPPVAELRVVLVNDDGVTNPAIDAMLGLLLQEEGLEVTVVAPAEERSGTGDSLTEGGATYEEASTPGGVRGYAVHGFPGDAVVVALERLALDPHLVVSGVNPGQNIGPLAAVSGTVGAARTAIRRGVPALAVSAGLTFDEEQFAFAAGLALDWIREHRSDLLAGDHQTETVTSINVPACPVDAMGELRAVPRAPELPAGVDVFESTCDLRDPRPDTDVEAIMVGYPSITQVPAELG